MSASQDSETLLSTVLSSTGRTTEKSMISSVTIDATKAEKEDGKGEIKGTASHRNSGESDTSFVEAYPKDI